MGEITEADLAVIGGGIIGLGIAWGIACSGRSVVVIDPNPADGATYAAAGMLAPVSEMHYQEEELLELMLASSSLYPAFIESLDAEKASVDISPTGYQTTRTISVGVDAADRRALADLQGVQRGIGLAIHTLTIREARALEPMLSPQLSGAFLAPHDHQVDPRRLAAQLREALSALRISSGWANEVEVPHTAIGLTHDDQLDATSRVTGVELSNGTTIHASEVIVANGIAAAQLAGLPEWLNLPLRPVFGDILRLRVPEHLRPLLTCTVRGVVHGVPIYVVPRADGTVVIGASQREDGFSGVSAGSVYQLLRDAQAIVPAVSELELLEVTARARPGTPDNAPLLGRVPIHLEGDTDSIPGLIIATGFFRHGVLLTPIAAQYCRQLVEGTGDARWAPFRPERFSTPESPAATAEDFQL